MDAFTSSGWYIGTDRIQRPLTDAEKLRLGRLLKQHDYEGVSLVALRFAYKQTRSHERAKDLMGRVNLRFMRWGWDPNRVSLVRAMCRLVWSELTHATEETDTARRAEEVFLREQEVLGEQLPGAPKRGEGNQKDKEPLAPSREQELIRLEEEREAEERKRADLEKLRELLRKKQDDVNLLYLDFMKRGIEDAATMAEESGRKVEEFYAAAKRRFRAVAKLLAEKNGAPPDDEENE